MSDSSSNSLYRLLRAMTTPNGREDFWKPQESLLHIAARNNDIPQLTELLKAEGVNPSEKNHHHLTPLHLLLRNDHVHVANAVAILLAAGANPNQQDNHGETPAHTAARHNHLESLTLFHECNKLDTTLRNREGETPLHTAVRSGHANIVHALLKYGADADACNNKKQTPRQLAAKSQEMQTIFNTLAPHEQENTTVASSKSSKLKRFIGK
ncbi:MAG: ankyrin repeat domain-containing protein [Gammaproteobacteria bacterium]